MPIPTKISIPALVYCFASHFILFFHDVEASAQAGWESRYSSEGRDILAGDSLFVGSFDVARNRLSGGIWSGVSPDQRYEEVRLSLTLTQSIGALEYYAGYTHLRFPFDDSHDNELGMGLVWSGLPLGTELSADIYYSTDVEGYFSEISVSREFAITDQLTLSVTSPLGINQGYVSDGHDGVNHIAVQVGLDYAIERAMSLTVYAAQSWALDRDSTLAGDEQLIDFFYGGVGLQWAF